MIERNTVLLGDCLELMKDIPDKSIDMILCDLPYGTTNCNWDIIIPFEPLWEIYKRIIKDYGAIVLFGSEPFSSYLRMSNIKNYKYDWVWNKKKTGNFCLAKYQPLKIHENIMVFNKNNYFPIKDNYSKGKFTKSISKKLETINMTKDLIRNKQNPNNNGYPKSIIEFRQLINFDYDFGLHPTQKPVKLFKYLIKTYTNEGCLVLDNCAGSGTTAIACMELKRDYILMEKEPKYYDIIQKRITEQHIKQRQLELI